MTEPLEPLVVAELATEAIEGAVAGDEERVMDALRAILVEGTKRDGLVFVVACMFTLTRSLPMPGRPAVLLVGGVQILPDGTIVAGDGALPPGQLLFAEILRDYIAGDGASCRDRWVAAGDEDATSAVEVAVSAAAGVVKGQRARLN